MSLFCCYFCIKIFPLLCQILHQKGVRGNFSLYRDGQFY